MPAGRDCPFCCPARSQLVRETDLVRVLRDGFPVSDGHTLVVPTAHVTSVFDLPLVEFTALWAVVAYERNRLAADLHCDGFIVGVNDGTAAGQTVPHAHIHIIPRFNGDVPDPRGGIRWIIPEKADYWSTREP